MRPFFTFRRSLVIVSILSLTLLSFAFRNQSAFSETRQSFTSMAAFITASMTGTLISDDGDNKLDPTNGNPSTTEKLQYTATITNSGADPASNVVFTDTIDSHTTLVANSLNASPIAFDQAVSTNEDTPLNITLTGTDPNGNSISFVNVTNTTNGVLSGTAPNLTYTPNANFNGTDNFTFKVNDGTVNSNEVGTISITINAVNDAPSLTVPGSQAFNEDTTRAFSTVNGNRVNVSDVDSASGSIMVTASSVHGNITVAPASVSVTNNGSHSVSITGTVSNISAALNGFIYTPDSNYNGTDTLSLHADDGGFTGSGGALTADASIALTIDAVNDAPIYSGATKTAALIANMPRLGVGGLLTGVTDPDDGEHGFTSVMKLNSVDASGCQCTVTIANADTGTVNITPNAGFAGATSFTFKVEDNGRPGVAVSNPITVQLTIAGPVIYFVKSSAVGAGNCTLGNDCTLSTAITNIGAASSRFIFISDSNGYTANVTLNGGGSIIGQGLTGFADFDTFFGITPPSGTPARPSINQSRPTINGTITLGGTATDTTVTPNVLRGSQARGFNINNTTANAAGITANSRTGIVISDMNVTTTSGTAVNMTSSSGSFTFGNVTSASGQPVVWSGGADSGTVTFNDVTATSLAVGATGVGISSNTSDFVFHKISTSGGDHGISLSGTSGGSFTVNGTSATDSSGGTIQNAAVRGAEFSSASNITLKNMDFVSASTSDGGTCTDLLTSACNADIYLNVVSTVTLDNISISGTTAQEGINGISVSNFILNNSTIANCGSAVEEGCIKMRELSGTSAITNSDISFPGQDVVEIVNTTLPSLLLNVNNSTFRDSQASGSGGNGLQIRSQGTASIVLNVNNSSFLRLRSNGLQATAINNASNDVDVTGCTFDTGTGTMIGLDLDADNSGILKFNVQNNPKIYSRNGPAINVFGDTGATIDGRINNNPDVKVLNNAGSNVGSGIRANINKDASARLEIKSNTVNIGSDDAGIDLSGIGRVSANPGGGTDTLNATVTGNNVTIGATSTYGLIIISASNAGDTNAICANVANNAVTRNPSSIFSFRARVPSANGFFRMQGFSTDASVTWNNNSNTPINDTSFGGSGTFGACTADTPTNPALSASSQYNPGGIDLKSLTGLMIPAYPASPAITGAIVKQTPPDFLTGRQNPDLQIFGLEPGSNNQTPETDKTILTGGFTAANMNDSRRGIIAVQSPAAAAPATEEEVSHTSSIGAVSRTAQSPVTAYGDLASDFISRASNLFGEVTGRLASIISPTVYAENNADVPAGNNSAFENKSPIMFAGETIRVDGTTGGSGTGFTLPAGKSVTITYQVTLNNPPNLTGVPPASPQISNQGTVSGSGFSSVLTDDPAVGGASDPTITPIDLFDTTTTVQSNNANPFQGEAVTFTATVVSNPTGNPTAVTGTVQFFDGATPIVCSENGSSTQTLNASGQAACTTTAITPAGSPHTIKAQYNGDGNFDPSSGTMSQTVQACTANPVVTTTADSGAGSLRAAIAQVCTAPNNNITFNLGAGAHTITLASELSVGRSVNITGPGANLLEIKGSQVAAGFRVFNVPNGITANISALTISSGGSAVGGGGVNNSGTLTLSACTVKGNQTTGVGGGGIYNAGALTINACTISNNVALVVGGGGIYNAATGTLTILNSTISTNTANGGGNGGGISNASAAASAITLKNDTIASNFADGAGGGIFNGAVPIDIGNTIVGDNDTTSHAAKDIGGAYNSLDFNLFETIDTAVITGTTTNNKTNVDAQLGALTDNGGSTLTHALLIDSPALDAGGNTISDNAGLTTDQRGTGFARKRDAADANTTQTVDIGAFEADPTIENITNKTTPEDTPLSFTFNVGDDATAFDSITAVSGAGDQTLVPNANVTVTGTAGTGQRTLSITPAANQNGTATITVTVTKTISGKTLSMSDTFMLTVSEINDAPVANADTLTNVAEDSGMRTISIASLLMNDSAGAPNENTQTLTLSLVSGSAVGGTVTSDATNVYFTPAADYNGIAGFQYTVTDNGTTNGAADPKTSGPAAVSFTIWDVNDAPVAVNDTLTSVNEDSGQRIIPFSDLTTNDNKGAANENAQILIVKTVGGAVGGMVSINGSNVLFTPDANFNGTASFTYTIEDNGTTNGAADPKTSAAAATVSFNVTAVNDAPTLDTITTPQTILEDADTVTVNLTGITAGPADESSQALTVTATSDNPGLIPNPTVTYTSLSATGTLTFKPVANQSGTAIITVTVTDNGATGGANVNTFQRTFTVNVTAVNDAPTLDPIPNPAPILRNAGQQTINLTGITAGGGETQTLTVTAVSNNPGLIPNPTVNYTSPNATGSLNYTPAANQSGTAMITVTVMDDGGTANNGVNSVSRSFTVEVVALADLSVTETDSPDPVIPGNNIAYTINVSNGGPATAAAAALTSVIPANTTYQMIYAPAGWTCTTPAVNGTGTVSCTNPLLPTGATDTFVLVVNVNTGTATGTVITNTTSVTATNPDPNTANNAASTTTTVAEYTSPAPTGQTPKAMLVKPAAGNTTAGGGASDTACTVPAGVTSAGTFANINQALGATNAGDTIYVCPKYNGSVVTPYIEQVSLGFTNLSVVGITDSRGSRAVIAANPNTPTTPTTQMGTNYIVQIVATGVNFGNFVVDGAPAGTNFAGTGIFNGIAVRRSGAFVFNNTVQNIRTADAATNVNGQGITVFGAGSAGSPLEAGTTGSPVNILNNVVQNFRSNGINVSAGSSSAYAFVRGNYIIGNGAAASSINQSGVQFLAGANGDIFNNRITNILNNNASACTAAAFNNCSAGIRLNTTAGTSANNLRVRFNTMNKTQTGIFGIDVQYLNIASNTITGSEIDGIHLQGSTFNLGSNFNLITANQIFSSRRSGIFIGQPGGDASLGNNINTNVIEDSYFGVEDFTPAGNNTITNTGAAANTFINVNRTIGNDGAANGNTTNPLP